MKRGIAWSRPSENFIIRRAKIELIRHGSKAIYIRNYLSLSCKLCVTRDFSKSKSHNRTERDSQGVGRDILIFRTMRTTRKQFLVNWLTSGRLTFTIQRAKVRRRQQIKKKWRHKWRNDVELILAFFNREPTRRNCLKLQHKRVLYKQR